MSSRRDNLGKCHRCPLRAAECGGPCACTVDGRDIAEHAEADDARGFCPHPGGPRYGTATPPPAWGVFSGTFTLTQAAPLAWGASVDPTNWRERASRLWRELHRVALTTQDVKAFARYVRDRFTPRVPCGICKESWKAILERMPPDLATDPFAWSVDAHNAVNVELDPPKSVVSLEEARRLHEPTKGDEGDDRTAAEARSIDS